MWATAVTTASRSSTRTVPFIEQWTQFSRPSGIFIDKQRQHLRGRFRIRIRRQGAHGLEDAGIRVGRIKDGSRHRILDPDPATDVTGPAPPKAWRWIRRRLRLAEFGPKT